MNTYAAELAEKKRIDLDERETLTRKIERALDGGELNLAQIVDQLGCGKGFAQDVKNAWMAKRMKQEEGAGAEKPAVEKAPVEVTLVDCRVAGAQITARACVDAQRDSQRCFCVKGVAAIRAVERDVVPGNDSAEVEGKKRRLREDLVILKGRCSGMLRKPPEQQFAGPALRAKNGDKNPASLIAGELPAPKSNEPKPVPKPPPARTMADVAATPAFVDRKAEVVDEREDAHEESIAAEENAAETEKASKTWPEFVAEKEKQREFLDEAPPPPPQICTFNGGCRTALRVNNLTGLCRLHRNKVSSRQRKHLVPKVARAAGTAGNALASDVVEPAYSEAARTCTWAEDKCTEDVSHPLNTTGLCPRHYQVAKSRRKRARRDGVIVDPGAILPLSHSEDRKCVGEGCGKLLASKTKGDRCVSCLKGVKPGGGWDRCAHWPRCPRMTQKLVNPLCALCRRGNKHHLLPETKSDSAPADERAPKEKKMPGGTPKDRGFYCQGCEKVIRSDNTRQACTPCIAKLPLSLQPKSGEPISAEAVAVLKAKKSADVGAQSENPAAGSSMVEGLDLKKLTIDQLIGAAKELRVRMAELDEQRRKAEFALAGEPYLPSAARS